LSRYRVPMRLVVPRSEVVTDDNGWTWLQPVVSSTRTRHTAGTFVLAVLILAAGATWTLLPQPAALAATGVVVVTGLWLLAGIVRGAASRVALSALGLYVQDGGSAEQVGWTAVHSVAAQPHHGRWRISIDDGTRARTTRAGFEPAAARQWLELVTAEAARRQLAPVPLAEGSGFTASPS
jgi:hypothetical protein